MSSHRWIDLHYVDEIQCAAARVVAAMRDHVRKRNPEKTNGDFDSFHIRRGDFQFKATRIEADQIYMNSKAELTPNSTIFIATDERNKAFFDPLRAHYDLLFLDDFKNELKGVNTNYYGMYHLRPFKPNQCLLTLKLLAVLPGMIDQLVSSRGR